MDKLGPYELNSIHCGECSKLLAALPDNSVDMWLTSPPYDNLRTYNGYVFPFEAIARQLYRVTKPGGVGVWVVGDATVNGSETGTSFRQALGFQGLGFNLWDTMFWEKQSRIPTESRYYNVIEYMFVFSKGRPKALNFITDHKNSTAGAKKQKDAVINKGRNKKKDEYLTTPEYSRRSNLWTYPTGQHDDYSNGHPAIFPEALAHDHIISWSNPGDLILDPMAGSGTTCKMAVATGRNYLGFDISAEYCDLARRRVGDVEREMAGEWKPMKAEGRVDDLPLFGELTP